MQCNQCCDNDVSALIEMDREGTGLVGWGMALPNVTVCQSVFSDPENVASVMRPTGLCSPNKPVPAFRRASIVYDGDQVLLVRDNGEDDKNRRLVFLRSTAVHNPSIAMMADFDHLVTLECDMQVERVISQTRKVFAGGESALALVVMAPRDTITLKTHMHHTPRHKSWFTRVKPKQLLTTRTIENFGADRDVVASPAAWNKDLGDKPDRLHRQLTNALRDLGYWGRLQA